MCTDGLLLLFVLPPHCSSSDQLTPQERVVAAARAQASAVEGLVERSAILITIAQVSTVHTIVALMRTSAHVLLVLHL
jgi:hypothetical protein